MRIARLLADLVGSQQAQGFEKRSGQRDSIGIGVNLPRAHPQHIDALAQRQRGVELQRERSRDEVAQGPDFVLAPGMIETNERRGRATQSHEIPCRDRSRQIIRHLGRTAIADHRRQRIGDQPRLRNKAQARNRAGIEPRFARPVGECLNLHAHAPARRRDGREFDEAAEPDHDLPIERIGLRQAPLQIAGQFGLILADEPDPPGLQVMRVGRQDGVPEGIESGIKI